MRDEVLAGLTTLIGVMDARVDERLLDPGSVDGDGSMLGVLLDDREQIPEQAPLGGRQLGAIDGAALVGAIDAVDRRPGGDQRRGRGCGRRAVPVLGTSVSSAIAGLRTTAQALRW